MEDFERYFDYRNGMICALRLLGDANRNAACKGAGEYDVHAVLQEFLKLFEQKYKELGG